MMSRKVMEMGKKLITAIMVLLVILIITLSYFLNLERKQKQQYEGYLSQYVGNEIGRLPYYLNENKKIWDKVLSEKTITENQIESIRVNHHKILENYVQMQQLAIFLDKDFENEDSLYFTFYTAVLDINDYLRHIDSDRLTDRSLVELNEDDIEKVIAIRSLNEEWSPIMASYTNSERESITENYWIDIWNELDDATHEKQELKEIIKWKETSE